MDATGSAGRRLLDHLVLPVTSIAMSRARLAQLGFTVAPDGIHPFGTANSCVFLSDGTYLEPLAVADREACEAAALNGNTFIARDQAIRFRHGDEGLTAIVVNTSDADADHQRFAASGVSAGPMLSFSRVGRLPDGTERMASFKLAFAADLRSPDFFAFACQRIAALPSAGKALETHENGVTGIAQVVLSEPNPADFKDFLQMVAVSHDTAEHPFGMDVGLDNAIIATLNPAGLKDRFGLKGSTHARGLRGRAVVFKVMDIERLKACLAENGVAFEERASRILVPHEPGQGVLFAFEEEK
ncbi:VOC family protein [Rhizobium sp. PAMB 3174]